MRYGFAVSFFLSWSSLGFGFLTTANQAMGFSDGDWVGISCTGALVIEGELLVSPGRQFRDRHQATGILHFVGKDLDTGIAVDVKHDMTALFSLDGGEEDTSENIHGYAGGPFDNIFLENKSDGGSHLRFRRGGKEHQMTCEFRHMPPKYDVECFESNSHKMAVKVSDDNRKTPQRGTVWRLPETVIHRTQVTKEFSVAESESRLRYRGERFLLSIDLASSPSLPGGIAVEPDRKWHTGFFRSTRSDLGIAHLSLLCATDKLVHD